MLAHDRPTLLLDEPTLGLDRHDTIGTVATLRESAAEGRGIMFASHDLRLVTTLADRIVVLAEGAVIADGPVHLVLRRPDVLQRAGLRLPALVAWLLEHVPSPAGVRDVLDALDDAATPPRASAAS